MYTKAWFLVALMLSVAVMPPALAGDVAPETLYQQAVAAMEGLPQPSFVSYRMVGESDGLRVGLVVQNGNVWLNLQPGTEVRSWTIHH